MHAHRNQIDADGFVIVQLECELELRADAVGAGDQHRIFDVFGKRAEPGETPDAADDVLGACALCERFDSTHELVACLDVDTRVAIRQPRHAPEARRLVAGGQRGGRR